MKSIQYERDICSNAIDSIYDKAYENGYQQGYINGKNEAYKSPVPVQDAYNNGLHDAWECMRKIESLPNSTYINIFGNRPLAQVIEIFSASEAIAKIKEYEMNNNQ